MKIFITIDENNYIESFFFDKQQNSIELQLEDTFDISKVQYCKYENNQLVYSQEYENILKQQELDYINNTIVEASIEQKNRADIDYLAIMTGVELNV